MTTGIVKGDATHGSTAALPNSGSSSSSSGKDRLIHVDRYPDGDRLTLLSSSKNDDLVTVGQLEQVLQSGLVTKQMKEALHHHPTWEPRADSHHLQCQSRSPLASACSTTITLLGLIEDEGLIWDHHSIQWTLFQRQSSPTSTHHDQDTAMRESYDLHSEWRRPNTSLEQHDHTDKITQLGETPFLQVTWVDLTNKADDDPVVSTRAGILQFLRSLLGSHHESSPWHDSSKTRTQRSCHHPSMADVVILAVPCTNENDHVLEDFRVSDASPSWFLHVVLPEWQQPSSSSHLFSQLETATTMKKTLLIYKRLSCRPHLMTTLPSNSTVIDTAAVATGSILPMGCLWERVPPPETDPDDADQLSSSEPQLGRKEEDISLLFRPCCPPYVNFEQEYPRHMVEQLFSTDTLEIFRQEAMTIPFWTPWPETQHYSALPAATGSNVENNKPWTVFPLCYCFPANLPENRQWVEATQAQCPKSCERLSTILGSTLRTALFSQLSPNTVLEAHTGWEDLANHVFRLHIPLVVPSPIGVCGTWVDGCVETHVEGRPLLFDDSKTHRAFNYSETESRIVLIVDLARPDTLPIGTATGGHTDELDQFIQQMSMPR